MSVIWQIGARVAPWVARALGATAWASLGWNASEAVNVATGTDSTDEGTTRSWQAMAGGGFLVGLAVLWIATKAMPLLRKKK